jgi:Response regulators consisting of a CheY-like receiver domain and a winged-helix DNA-binding domain
MQPADVQKGFGAEVKRRRVQLGISQEKLAERANLHRTYVSDVEAGKRNPSLASIQRLTLALGASLGAIFASVEDGKRAEGGNDAGHKLGDILLVEDNAKDIELTLAAFRQAKLTNPIQVVHDGIEALDFVFCRGHYGKRPKTDRPQVVLLDLQLPKIHGLEVLRRIKADEYARKIPVVVLTVSQRDDHIHEALRLGAQSYIVKPVDFQNFSESTSKLSFRWAMLNPAEGL